MNKIPMVGPEVPPEFVDDGCSLSPNGWWKEACRIHDYEYQLIRVLTSRIKSLQSLADGLVIQGMDPDALPVRDALAEIKYLKSKVRHARRTADINLQENMRRLSEHGRWTKRASGWLLSRRYYGAVHRWGWKAVWGEGHPDNRGKEWK